MKKKQLLLPIMLLTILLLTGCVTQSGLVITDSAPVATISPCEIKYAAPIGDAALEYEQTIELYFPAYDGKTTVRNSTTVMHTPSRPFAETIVRELLESSSSPEHDSLGGKTKLTLYGSTPVEVSRNTAVIHLSATAKQLDKNRQYLVCQAIANSLCRNTDIESVSFLIGGQPFALDLGEKIPCGAFSFQDSTDHTAQYQQKLSTSSGFSENTEKTLLNKVLLYFPIPGTEGVLTEDRMILFDSSTPGGIVQTLLGELAAGPETKAITSPALLGNVDFLTAVPNIAYSKEAHGNVIDLRFADNWQEMINAYQLSENAVFASLCLTLCTYVPDVVGLSISVGGTPIDTDLLIEDTDTELPAGKIILRKNMSTLLLDECTLYLPQRESRQIAAVKRPVPFMQVKNPRSLLINLCSADQPGDSRSDTLPALNHVADTDIIGMCLENDTLVVNLALSFMRDRPLNDGITEQQMAYAMVNTLCENGPYQSVCFIQGGSWPEGFEGSISWQGEFYPWFDPLQ